jgi:hypothetical protein
MLRVSVSTGSFIRSVFIVVMVGSSQTIKLQSQVAWETTSWKSTV